MTIGNEIGYVVKSLDVFNTTECLLGLVITQVIKKSHTSHPRYYVMQYPARMNIEFTALEHLIENM